MTALTALQLRIDEIEAHLVELQVSLRDAAEDFDGIGDRLLLIKGVAEIAFLEFERDWKPDAKVGASGVSVAVVQPATGNPGRDQAAIPQPAPETRAVDAGDEGRS